MQADLHERAAELFKEQSIGYQESAQDLMLTAQEDYAQEAEDYKKSQEVLLADVTAKLKENGVPLPEGLSADSSIDMQVATPTVSQEPGQDQSLTDLRQYLQQNS